MKNNAYWLQRAAAQRMYEYQKSADKAADEIAKAYIEATDYINDEIIKLLKDFSINSGLSDAEARRVIEKLDDNVTPEGLKSAINTITNAEAKQKLLSLVNSAAYAFRIKRFERLQKNIDVQTARLAELEQKITETHYIALASEAYMHSTFDIQKSTGLGFSFAKMPVSRIDSILSQNWSGALFSERIWGKASKVNASVKEELLVGFLTGRSYRKTAAEIEYRMAVGANDARRLVRTESTYIANSAEIESYRECGISKYRFLATLDKRTSDICAALDGKEFDMEKAMPGENMPPLHPYCRSTTIAVIDDAVLDGLKRRAKDPETGKYYEMPENLTYEQWKSDFVGNESERYTREDYKNIEQTKVSWHSIYTEKWRKNFDGISNNQSANNTLRNVAEQMLKHRDGTFYEDMYLINAKTGKIEGFNTTCNIKQRVAMNESLKKALSNDDLELIGIHNHPFSSIPSLSDLNSIAKRSNQFMGVIICHDGTIFTYTKPIIEIRNQDYKTCLTKHKKYSKITRENKGFADLSDNYGFVFRRLDV